MFKKLSHTLFKRIILFLLFGFVILLMTINIPLNSSKTDNLSSFEIKQKSLHTNPTETQKQAVWTFLTTNNRLQDIKKRLIPYIGNVDISTLHNVESTTSYDDLSNNVQNILSQLWQIDDYEIKINTDIANDKTNQAVWDFLKSQENFKDNWRATYTNWLDIIQKRKPQKTLWDADVNAVVDLSPLWDVDLTSRYSSLTPKVRKVLLNLSKLKNRNTREYKVILRSTLQYFSFQKEKGGEAAVVVELIKMLKASNRWYNLNQYKIQNIADVDISPLLSDVNNIIGFTADWNTYNAFTENVKASLRNLLDLDLNLSPFFNSVDKDASFFKSRKDYMPIINALGTRIDNIISGMITKLNALLTFLKQNNRSKDIRTRKISRIAGVDVTSLYKIYATDTITYDNLWLYDDNTGDTLFELLQIPNYDENTIDNFIQYDKDAEAVWDFLKTQEAFEENWKTSYTNWLDLINKHKPQKTIWDKNTSAAVDLKSLWSVNSASLYKDLTPEVKKTLLELSKLSHSSNADWNYKNIIKKTLQYFAFAKETYGAAVELMKTLKTNDRWINLKKYQIKQIKDVNIESLSTLTAAEITALVVNKNSYDALSSSIRTTLRNLLDLDLLESPKFNEDASQIFISPTNYNPILAALAIRIDNIITPIKFDVNNVPVWNFLKLSDRLTNISQFKISQIGGVDISSLYAAATTTTYDNLSSVIKETLHSLSQISNYQTQIDLDIVRNQETKIAWTFLKTSNRLTNIKQYKIKTIDTVELLPVLESATTSTLYIDLSNSQRNILYTLSQRPNYQDKVDEAIQPSKITFETWTFLTTNNRLANLKLYQINVIDGVTLLPNLGNIETSTPYSDLIPAQKTLLYTLGQKIDYSQNVNTAIATAQTAASNAWTFLTTNDRLQDIKQYEIKTIDTLELLPFFQDVVLATEYESLTDVQKIKFYNLSKIANYQTTIDDAIAFAQNASSAWIFLTTNDRLTNIKKYQINTINGATLLPILVNIGTSNLYIRLSSIQKNLLYALSQTAEYQSTITGAIQKAQTAASTWDFLRNDNRLVNIKKYQINTIDDISLLLNFTNVEISTLYADLSSDQKTLLYTLNQKADYQQKVDDAIQTAQMISDVLFFLKTENRLANLKQYQINIIDGITLLPNLENIEPSTRYTDLSSVQKTLLYNLNQKADYQDKVNDAIAFAQNASNAWTFLKTKNRLSNIKQYQINIIDDISLLPNLENIEPSTRYTDLSSLQKTLLYNLNQKADYQNKVNDAIQNAEAVSFEVWIFLRKKDRLSNIKKYKIDKIETVALSPLWKIDSLFMNYTNFLINKQKFTFDSLSKIMKYKEKIDTAIAQAKKQTLALWNYLIKTNLLKDIQKYEIKRIASVDISSLMIANLKKTFDQQSDNVQDEIIKLTKLSDYKLKIQDKVQNIKSAVVWDYLKKSKRIQNIKKYQITMINGIEVSHLKTANMNQDYTEQNADVKKDLTTLSKISFFENQIDQRIKNHNTIEDNNDRTLLTGIILLSLLVFLFLASGTSFYLYKKFWISKAKK